MAQFAADIAGILELFAIAAGLVLLHRVSKEAPAKLLEAAGRLLVASGLVVGACTTFYWFDYQSPEQVLKRRYAKGEIDHETYLRMLKELEG